MLIVNDENICDKTIIAGAKVQRLSNEGLLQMTLPRDNPVVLKLLVNGRSWKYN